MNKSCFKKTTLLLYIIAFLFIFVGVRNQEFLDVFSKAKLICLECIGIG